jgi:multidrug efflux pump subunit AcrB
MLTSATGAKIPLSQVAEVKLSTGESTITREMNKRHLTVKLNLRGTDLSSFLKIAQIKLKKTSNTITKNTRSNGVVSLKTRTELIQDWHLLFRWHWRLCSCYCMVHLVISNRLWY